MAGREVGPAFFYAYCRLHSQVNLQGPPIGRGGGGHFRDVSFGRGLRQALARGNLDIDGPDVLALCPVGCHDEGEINIVMETVSMTKKARLEMVGPSSFYLSH